jgi:curved DNA-binding protein CbpA
VREPENPHLQLNAFSNEGQGRQVCDHPDCNKGGAYRAPRSPDRLRDYYWFCLDHVREYNAAWDYFARMSADEIDQYRRQVPSWHRPTWPLNGQVNGKANGNGKGMGKGKPGDPGFADIHTEDPLDIFAAMGGEAGSRFTERRYSGRGMRPLDARDREALDRLGLDESATKDDIRRTYRRLVKRYHPDANGGDRRAEDRFKGITEAYRHLLAHWQDAT